jgi:hypothetical protein
MVQLLFVYDVQLAPNELEFRLRNAKFNEADTGGRKKTGSTPADGHTFDPTWSQYNVPRRSPLPPVKAKPMVSVSDGLALNGHQFSSTVLLLEQTHCLTKMCACIVQES